MRCNELGGGCAGSSWGNCEPHVAWGSSPLGSGRFHAWLNTGVFYHGEADPLRAFSVRCLHLCLAVSLVAFASCFMLQCAVSGFVSSPRALCLYPRRASLIRFPSEISYGLSVKSIPGSVQCGPYYGGCAGSINGNCNPNAFWSGTLISGSSYHAFWADRGTINTGSRDTIEAYSVRCRHCILWCFREVIVC